MKDIINKDVMDIILNNISDGVQIINKKGELIFSNENATLQDDIGIKEALGKHILSVYPSLTKETSTLLKVLDTGQEIRDFEQVYSTYKGKEINTLNTTLPLKKGGKIIGALEISKDISHVKELSEKVRMLRDKAKKKNVDIIDDEATYNFSDILSMDPKIQMLKIRATRAAKSEMPLLVSGETGTGKELLVQSIHNASRRMNSPFIAQNCASLPATLLEGILFGTKKGSFTGSIDRPGLFELANNGTLFLDEINSMPMELQAKLLRVLQEKSIRRLGDIKTRKVDVRVIAATNIDPLKAIEEGKLRKDLFYRLNTISLEIPPLRKRKGDILKLTEFFINKFNKESYLNIEGVTKKVENILTNYSWPGNVRELEYVIKASMHIADGKKVKVSDLPSSILKYEIDETVIENRDDLNLTKAVSNLEIQMIKLALEESGDNITKAASILSIPRQTLQYKLKKYNIDM